MSNTTDGLNIRFDVALRSISEREFYQSLYYYFDFIHKAPELKAIFEQSEREYSKKHFELWRKRPMTDEEADEASAQTTKLERFNLFAVGSLSYVRIYLPIDDYRNTDEPDSEQDPVAVMLMRGVDYAASLGRWSKAALNRDNTWFKDKRSLYETNLRRFHIMLLDELMKPREVVITKPKLDFDAEASILKIDDKRVEITLKNDKPIDHYVLEYIFKNPEGLGAKSYYTDIIAAKFPQEDKNERSLRRACESINKKVSEQAGVSRFLRFESGKSGSVQVNADYL